jgi:hypothetical protein
LRLVVHVQHKLLAHHLLHLLCLLLKSTNQPIEVLHINQQWIYNQYCKNVDEYEEMSSV